MDDIPAVRAIDSACFPPGDPDHEPAPSGELEDGVLADDVTLVQVGRRPCGLHAH